MLTKLTSDVGSLHRIVYMLERLALKEHQKLLSCEIERTMLREDIAGLFSENEQLREELKNMKLKREEGEANE